MMDGVSLFVLSLYGMLFVAGFIILIYLIIRRVNIKDQETFEKRDN